MDKKKPRADLARRISGTQNIESSTDEIVKWLSEPTSFSNTVKKLEVIETTRSWVFIADSEVFKIKKPLKDNAVDFQSLESRRLNVLQETRLNRRLASSIYLNPLQIKRNNVGDLSFNGDGETVDWVVHMRRLPANLMLDKMLQSKKLSNKQIAQHLLKIVSQLASLYKESVIIGLDPTNYISRFLEEHELSVEVLSDPYFEFDHDRLNSILRQFEIAAKFCTPILIERVNSGKVVEGHGDLRPEHICLIDPPVIIDCMEFSRRIRLVDPFDELGFLGQECAMLGESWVTDFLLSTGTKMLNDVPPRQAVLFYRSFRALLWARISVAHLCAQNPINPKRWIPRAKRYLAIAEASLKQFS